jgi:hypothetical protein
VKVREPDDLDEVVNMGHVAQAADTGPGPPMTRLLPLVAVLLPLLPLQGLGAIGAQGFDCEPVGVGSEDEAERGCTSDCCCGEVCPCAEAPPPEPPFPPSAARARPSSSRPA